MRTERRWQMPNWCDTTYKCVGDLKEVKSLYRMLKCIDKRDSSIKENGFGKWWLGNLVIKLGGDWEKYPCRGEITGYSIDGNVLTIEQYTAWHEQEGVREIIEKKFPSIKVYYREEESGCGVYYTNDDCGIFFPEKYIVEVDWKCFYFNTIEEAAECISDRVGRKVPASLNDLVEAVDDYMEKNEDDFISINEFELIA